MFWVDLFVMVIVVIVGWNYLKNVLVNVFVVDYLLGEVVVVCFVVVFCNGGSLMM